MQARWNTRTISIVAIDALTNVTAPFAYTVANTVVLETVVFFTVASFWLRIFQSILLLQTNLHGGLSVIILAIKAKANLGIALDSSPETYTVELAAFTSFAVALSHGALGL